VLTVPLRSKRRERAILLQKLQHAAPAVVLLGAGLTALGEDAHGFALALAILEIVSSVTLFVTIILALRQARRPANAAASLRPHHGPDWIDVFTAAVLFTEAIERYHHTHHIARPTILLAVVLLTIGLLHGRIVTRAGRRMTLQVGDDDLFVGGRPFRTLRVKWADLASIEVGGRYATVTARDGRRRKLDLEDLEGADAVRAALEGARQRLAELNSGIREPSMAE
jgi:hypothetical protein